eukprot:2632320-Pyramimonas_sp.AAC.1
MPAPVCRVLRVDSVLAEQCCECFRRARASSLRGAMRQKASASEVVIDLCPMCILPPRPPPAARAAPSIAKRA